MPPPCDFDFPQYFNTIYPPKYRGLVKEGGTMGELHNEFIPYARVVGYVNSHVSYKSSRFPDIFLAPLVEEEFGFPSEYAPAVLEAKASYRSMGKYFHPEVAMSNEYLEFALKAGDMLEDELRPFCNNCDIIDFEEALSTLDLQAGCGFPWNHVHKTKETLVEDPEFIEFCKADFERMNTDENYFYVYKNSLKDELRDIERVLAGKTRTFLASAAHSLVHDVRLFSDFNNKFMKSHLKIPSTAGMNPWNGGWHRFILLLKDAHLVKFSSTDVSGFDAWIMKILFAILSQVKFNLHCQSYQIKYYRAFMNSLRNRVYSVIMSPHGLLVIKSLGNPSGSFETLVFNTMVTAWMRRFEYLILTPSKFHSLPIYHDTVRDFGNGDDNFVGYSQDVYEFLTFERRSQLFAELGCVMTQDMADTDAPEKQIYLSARTRVESGFYIPYYDEGKLIASLYYSPESSSIDMTLIRLAGLYMVGWTNEKFRAGAKRIVSKIRELYPALEDFDIFCRALALFKSDRDMFRLVVGLDSFAVLSTQDVFGSVERYIKPWIKNVGEKSIFDQKRGAHETGTKEPTKAANVGQNVRPPDKGGGKTTK